MTRNHHRSGDERARGLPKDRAALRILHWRQQLEALLRERVAYEGNIVVEVPQHSYRRIVGLIANEKGKSRLSVRTRSLGEGAGFGLAPSALWGASPVSSPRIKRVVRTVNSKRSALQETTYRDISITAGNRN